MNIDSILEAIRRGRIRISDHADEESEAGALTFDEIYLSLLHGEIIEIYPTDKPYPRFSGKPSAAVPFTPYGLIMKTIGGQCW